MEGDRARARPICSRTGTWPVAPTPAFSVIRQRGPDLDGRGLSDVLLYHNSVKLRKRVQNYTTCGFARAFVILDTRSRNSRPNIAEFFRNSPDDPAPEPG